MKPGLKLRRNGTFIEVLYQLYGLVESINISKFKTAIST